MDGDVADGDVADEDVADEDNDITDDRQLDREVMTRIGGQWIH